MPAAGEQDVDSDLVVRAKSGDHGAFEAIAASLVGRYHGIAYAILRDRTLAEDAAQAALVGVWRDLPRLRDVSRFEAWAYRILLNACFSEGRRARWRGREVDMPSQLAPVAPDQFHTVLDRDQLERGFRRLTLDQRAVLVAHYYLDLPSDEAASWLDIPLGTYKSRLHRATAAMRSVLDADARAPAFQASTGVLR
jgi:RNA polymerase sigma-70 factor (ECF subfamily)